MIYLALLGVVGVHLLALSLLVQDGELLELAVVLARGVPTADGLLHLLTVRTQFQ